MDVWVVIKVGIYRHDIWGVYATEAEAKSRAVEALSCESDDYHIAEIVRMAVGQPGEQPVCRVVRADTHGPRAPDQKWGKGPVTATSISEEPPIGGASHA
jgi:hypothetical protein